MLCRVAAVKILPVHHHSADYTVWSFGITGFILSYLENIILLKPTLGGVVSVGHLLLKPTLGGVVSVGHLLIKPT